jgi:protein-S-isoprenylcysteine O-methyltransferase Ste14
MALALGEIRGLIGLLLIAVSVWHKGRVEEQFLFSEFGAEFAAYWEEVKFLIPFIL